MNKTLGMKAVVGVAIVFIFSAFVPAVNSQSSTNFNVSLLQKLQNDRKENKCQEFVIDLADELHNDTINEDLISNVDRNSSLKDMSYKTMNSPSIFYFDGNKENLGNIPPEIKNITDNPDPQEAGGYVNISCDVTDNVGVNDVKVNITFPDGSYLNESMLGGSYYYNSSYVQVGSYDYFIWANDTSDNANISAVYSFTIMVTEGASGTYLVNETDIIRYSFLNGTFDSTLFDNSIDAIVLNNSFSGNFTSQVFDAYSIASWNNISWVSNAIGELPNNRQSENIPGGINMADNEVLFHFDNQSEYNENDSYLHDFSGSGHYGNNTAVLVSNGKIGGGCEFDGVSDHRIIIKDGMEFWDNAENWSIVMWIYARSSQRNIISKRDDCAPWIWIGQNYRIGFSSYYGVSPPYVENVSSTLPYAVDPNKWTHLSMTRNGSNISVYKNGILHTSLNSSTTQNGNRPGIGDLQIGAYNADEFRLNGSIDELAFFSRALSGDEIRNMYERGLIRLNVSVSSCDDVDCVGESWIDINDTSPQNLSVLDNRYFQYRFVFGTDNLSYSPELYNVTIHYTAIDTIPPEITNVDASVDLQTAGRYVNISCDVTDDVGVNVVKVNITYPDGSYHNETMLGGSYYFNSSYFQVGVYDYFIWANDTSGNSITSAIYHFNIKKMYNISLNTNWNLMSIPFNESIDKTDIIVRNNSIDYNWTEAVDEGIVMNYIYKWDGTFYTTYDILDPGLGYWIWAYYSCELIFYSNAINNDYLATIQQKWNLIGLPYNQTLEKGDIIVHYDGIDYTWNQAVQSNIILEFVYGWNRATQMYMLSDEFDPGYGYWMYSYYDCILKREVT